MNIKHSSCCDLVEQRVNFWFTNSGKLVIESEILSRVVMSEYEVETLRNYLSQG